MNQPETRPVEVGELVRMMKAVERAARSAGGREQGRPRQEGIFARAVLRVLTAMIGDPQSSTTSFVWTTFGR
jgi:hypothetical protein